MPKIILVVEDDADLRVGIADLLTSEGYTVKLARDGLEGWDMLQANPDVALVLLDYTMPRLDAKGFRELQRSRPELDRVPVILFSAAVLSEDTLSALAATAVVRKPVDIDVLLNTVSQISGF